MKIRFLIVALVFASVPAVCYFGSLAQNSVFVPNCTGNATTDTATLTALKNSIGSNVAVIDLPYTATRCSVNSLTLPVNITLSNDHGSGISLPAGQLLSLGSFRAPPDRQSFFNANGVAGQGTVTFTGSPSKSAISPLWWGTNTAEGTTDMTAPIQAALNASGGRGKVDFPCSTYVITASLTIPDNGGGYAPMIINGCGALLSNLVNKAPAGNPTLIINKGAVIVQNLGFWGSTSSFPNDGISVSQTGGTYGSRAYIRWNKFFTYGHGIKLQQVHSVYISENFGALSGDAATFPPGVVGGWAYTDQAFVYGEISGSLPNQIIIDKNISEGYAYPVRITQTSGGAFVCSITRNQFEGATNGLKLEAIYNLTISDNYLGEGSSGYAIDLNNCRGGVIGPNYIHFDTFDSKSSTVKLNDCFDLTITGVLTRLYITGTSNGLRMESLLVDRIQDESSDHMLSAASSTFVVFPAPKNSLNMQNGRAFWDSDTVSFNAYPTVRAGDEIRKVTPVAGGSPGWICTTGASSGWSGMTQTAGTGPDPVVLNDYIYVDTIQFRITMLTGGATGTATYKVEWRVPAGTYADLMGSTVTTELAHLVIRDTGSGPPYSFAVRWPLNQTYVAGDKWEFTATAPVWKARAALAS